MKKIALFLLLTTIALSKQPSIQNLNIRQIDGCIFADLEIHGGPYGNYFLMWSSPEFIVPNMWIPVSVLTNNGSITRFDGIPLYTNFNNVKLMLKKI